MGAAVVYYSAQGNSALAARALAEKLGAALVELKEKKRRDLSKINFSFMAAGFQASMRLKSRLQGEPWKDVSGCGELHLITPIWASKPAPAMNAFLSKCDFAGRTVYLYTVQADPNDAAKPAREAMAKYMQGKGGTVAGSHGLTGGAPGKEPRADIADKICSLVKS